MIVVLLYKSQETPIKSATFTFLILERFAALSGVIRGTRLKTQETEKTITINFKERVLMY